MYYISSEKHGAYVGEKIRTAELSIFTNKYRSKIFDRCAKQLP